ELESVAAEPGCKHHIPVFGVPVDDEILVRGHRVHADGALREPTGHAVHAGGHERTDLRLDVTVVDLAVEGVRVRRLAAAVDTGLGARHTDLWQAIDVGTAVLGDPAGEDIGCDGFRPGRLEPQDRLAAYLEWQADGGQQVHGPGAAGDAEPVGGEGALRRLDPNSVAIHGPVRRATVCLEDTARPLHLRCHGAQGRLDLEVAGARRETRLPIVRDVPCGETAPHLGSIDPLVVEAVRVRGGACELCVGG